MRLHQTAFSLMFVLVACGRNDTEKSSTHAVRDADLVEALPDGPFRVRCKDGKVEIVTQEQMSRDAVCVPPPPPPPPPPPATDTLCGVYKAPLTLGEGVHVVTCDVTFLEKVVIQPGARLLADAAWEMSFRNDLFAFGSADKPIEFGISGNADAESWSRISIEGRTPIGYNTDLSYKSGSFLSHVKVAPVQNVLALQNVFATEIDATVLNGTISLLGFLGRSRLASRTIATADGSYFVHNAVRGSQLEGESASFYMTRSFVAWNRFERMTEDGYALYLYPSGASYVLHNSFVGRVNTSDLESSLLLGNVTDTGAALPLSRPVAPVVGDASRPDAVVVGPFPLSTSTTVEPNEEMGFPMVIADRNGWRFDLLLTTTPFYRLDGMDYFDSGAPVKGYYPRFRFAKKESYGFKFAVNDPAVPLVSPIFKLNVY